MLVLVSAGRGQESKVSGMPLYAEYRALYSGHGNDGPLSPGNDRYDPEHHQAVHRIVHVVDETYKTVRPINVRQLWTLKRHDKRMHCFCEFFRDGKLVHGRPVLKWAMFRITVGSIQRTVVFYTHSGPTGRMFYPRSTVESETGSQVDRSLKPREDDEETPSLLYKNEFCIVEKFFEKRFNSLELSLTTKGNARRLPHERKHAGQRPPADVGMKTSWHSSFPHVHGQDSLVMDPEADEKMEEKKKHANAH
ncbi:hypothetical protein ALC56_08367 [Trachymyrmex septentrionalis]|uniref:Uncharacterized protein n=1 Tax=Trachymyrmex septentrionalis TaxID=34720 RepID=A0A195FB92_9HYME|nr:hypothetical protein ALC56_08367 [Trachymyrmex septentrionalis]